MFSSLNILRTSKSRRMRWTGYVPRCADSRGAYRVLVGRRGGMMPSGRTRCRWEDNFKMNEEVGWSIAWIDLVQDRDRWRAVVKSSSGLSGSIKCGEFLERLRTC